MPNQYVNKVVQSNGTTLMDISDTTAVASDVASGKYFYLASGEKVAGTASGGGSVTWEILTDQNITIVADNPNYFLLTFTEPLQADETYRITWGNGGTEYVCSTTPESIGVSYDGFCMGNAYIAGPSYPDTGEPFFLYRNSSTRMVGITNQSAGTWRIKIERQQSGGTNQDYEDALTAFGVQSNLTSGITALTTYANEITGESDTTLSDAVRSLADGYGGKVKTGTFIPKSASTTVSFDTGLTDIHGILILPVDNPYTGSRTQYGMICIPSGAYFKSISIYTNQGGTGNIQPITSTSDSRFSLSGTTVTVTGSYNWRTITYLWYAW